MSVSKDVIKQCLISKQREVDEAAIEYKSSIFAPIQTIKEKSERKVGVLYGI